MKYFKVTCIKALPEVKEGFSYTFSEEALNSKSSWSFSNNPAEQRAICMLRAYHKNTEFMRTEVDLSKAIPDLVCPSCGRKALFPHVGSESSRYDGDVTYFFRDVMLECGICEYTRKVSRVCTGKRISW